MLFWGDTSAKDNSLSGGPAPAAFKGFVPNPACGTNWTTGAGASATPPAGPLPDHLGVIVTDHATQAGARPSGDTAHLVIVHTDPGYGPDPTQHGTGTVVATVC